MSFMQYDGKFFMQTERGAYNMRSVQYLSPNNICLVEAPIPEIPAGWARIKVSRVGICGGDLGIYSGTHPRARPPLIPGHEFSGVLDTDAVTLKKGTPVTVFPLISCGKCTPCLTGDAHVCNILGLYGFDEAGAMADYVVVPQECLIKLPDGISFEIGALIEPIAVAVHSVRETNFLPGDKALIFGAGPIGLCIALVLRQFGAREIVVVDNDLFRLGMAAEMGFETVDPDASDIIDYVMHKTDGDGYDRVYDCAGVPAVAACLFDVTKVRGQIVIVAGYKKPAELQLFKGMIREVKVEFVRVYRKIDFEIAAAISEKEALFGKIITHVLPLEKAQEGFDLLFTKGSGAVKVMYSLD